MTIECESMRWIVNKEIVPLYIDTAKSFATLSSSALALSVVFYEKVIGLRPGENINRVMATSWILYLLAIGAAALYQYLAVKFLDSISCFKADESHYLQKLAEAPGAIYGAMLLFFLTASGLLILAAWRQIPFRRP